MLPPAGPAASITGGCPLPRRPIRVAFGRAYSRLGPRSAPTHNESDRGRFFPVAIRSHSLTGQLVCGPTLSGSAARRPTLPWRKFRAGAPGVFPGTPDALPPGRPPPNTSRNTRRDESPFQGTCLVDRFEIDLSPFQCVDEFQAPASRHLAAVAPCLLGAVTKFDPFPSRRSACPDRLPLIDPPVVLPPRTLPRRPVRPSASPE